MRFLYADSEPFPLGYDFLASLESLVRHGAQATHHLIELAAVEAEITQSASVSIESIRQIESFGDQAEGALGAVIITAPDNPSVATMGDELIELVKRVTAHHKTQAETQLRQSNVSKEAQSEAHREAIRRELEQFLLEAELDATTSDATLELRDGRYAIEATRQLSGNIAVTYAIDPHRFEGWSEPRKVASVTDGLEQLQVGLKKKFLRSDMTREIVKVADHTILSVQLSEGRAEIQIEKKGETMLLSLEREGDGVQASIERPQPERNSMFPAVPSDTEKLAGLWAALENVGSEALRHRESVVGVRVDDVDVFAIDQPGLLLDRLIEVYAPIAQEIGRRSPSPKELSLKVEHPDGRREERYVAKAALSAHFEGLHRQVVGRFQALPLS